MPSLTRDELVTRVGLLVEDPSNVRWDSTTKISLLNQWQDRFVLDTRALTDVASSSVVAGTQEYDLPSDILSTVRVVLNGIELRQTGKVDIDDNTNSDWTQTTGQPHSYYIDLDPDNLKIGLYPVPTAAEAGSSNLKIEYTKQPTALSASSSVPFNSHTLLGLYGEALAYGCAYQLLLTDPTPENLARAARYLSEYGVYVAKAINNFRAMRQRKPLRLRGGRFFRGR